MTMKQIDRRDFMKASTAAGLAAGLGVGLTGALARMQDAKPAKKLNLLILGGTGFLGPAIVDAALARGHSITLFHRGKTNPDMYPDLTHLIGDRDPEKGEGLKALEDGDWDAALDTSGYFPRMVNASAGLLADRIKQYVFISSISVYSDGSIKGMDESAPVATIEDETVETITGGTYGALKYLCERAALEKMDGRATNIRAGFIVGPLDRAVQRFPLWVTRVATRDEIACPGDQADPVQLVDARDIGDFCIHCIEQKTYGDFNVTGPRNALAVKAMVDDVCKGVKTDPKRTWIPTEFLEGYGGEGNEAAGWFVPWLPSTGEAAGYGCVSVAKAIDAGLTYRPLDVTARDTWTWLQTKPERISQAIAGIMDSGREDELIKAWKDKSAAG